MAGGGATGSVGGTSGPIAQPVFCSLRSFVSTGGGAGAIPACLATGSRRAAAATQTGGGATAAGATADPQTLAQRAAATLELPAPAIRTNPAGEQVVQLPMWLWIAGDQWTPRRASATAGPVTSTVTATPVRVTWDMGNGDRVSCEGPGRPYEERFAQQPEATDCRYTFRLSSVGQPDEAYQVTATVHWELTWNASGAAGGGSLGGVPMSTTQPVRVAQIQALVQ